MNRTNTVMRAGMIGLGAMGLQFARHMTRKGFDVAGYDIDSGAVQRAAADGIKPGNSPAAVGRHAEVAVIMASMSAGARLGRRRQRHL